LELFIRLIPLGVALIAFVIGYGVLRYRVADLEKEFEEQRRSTRNDIRRIYEKFDNYIPKDTIRDQLADLKMTVGRIENKLDSHIRNGGVKGS